MSKRGLVLGCGVSVLLTACYVTTSFEGLSSGGPATDAGGDTTTASDAGGDAPADARSDATADAGACVVPGLTTRLCDEFERDDPRGPWTSDLFNNGGSIEIAIDAFTKSRVFHSRVPRVQNGLAQAYQRFQTRLTRRVRFEGDLRYTNPSFEGARQIAVLDVAGAGKVYVAMLVLTTSGMAFYEQVDPGLPTVKTQIHPLQIPFTAGDWHRFSIDLDLTTNTATILVDGARALPPDEVYDHLAQFAGDELTVTIGPSYSAAPSAEMDTWFDHVIVASD